jgi:hypothetical protein
MGFEVQMEVYKNITGGWDIAPYILVVTYNYPAKYTVSYVRRK